MARTPSEAPADVSALALVPGALWSATLFVVLGFGRGARPESGGQYAILLFLSLFVGLLHAALLATSASLLGRSRLGRRLPRATDAALALITGSLYAYLALSLAKFERTGAQLRFDDLWFLATSPLQAAGEGTGTERAWIAGAALAPLVIATLVYALLRRARGRAPTIAPGAGLGLLAVGALGLAAVLIAHPAGRWAAATLLPDTSAVARAWARTAETSAESDATPDPSLQARLDAPRGSSEPRRWNVVVVLLESVPWSRLEGPAARPESTPRLLELARESVRFERASATSSHSDYAQTSILSSLYPRKGSAHDYFTELDYPRSLPWDVLGPHGWRSAVFSTQNEQWGNMLAFLRTPRLELLRHAPDFPDAPHRGDGSETKLFEETAVTGFLGWLDSVGGERSDRFVAYLNFQATHYPYVWPADFEPPYGAAPIDFPTTFLDYPPAETPVMLDRFHNALAYVDLWTGRLVDGLRAAGLWDSTALVLISDHGESFHEHGLVTHGTTLLEEQLRVPMWIRLPGVEPRVVTEPVSTLDALPALYRAMGLPRDPAQQGDDGILDPDYSAEGRPLFATLQGMTREDAILVDGWKWIVNQDRREGALFDLRTDPFESRNLVLAEPERRARLDAALARFLTVQIGYYRSRGWRSGWGPPRLPPTLPAAPPGQRDPP